MDRHAGRAITLGLIEGPSLLQMPEEILQLISQHLTASEWASGPCLTCRPLCNLELPDLTLYPVIDVPGMIYIEKCPGVFGKPCSEECGLTASKVVRALLWATKRSRNATAVFGRLLSACHKARHKCSAKAPSRKSKYIAAHLGGLPQYGRIRILDARTTGLLGTQYKTNTSAQHDRIWMLKGIEHVQEDLDLVRPWKADSHCRQHTPGHLEPLQSQATQSGSLDLSPKHSLVPANKKKKTRDRQEMTSSTSTLI